MPSRICLLGAAAAVLAVPALAKPLPPGLTPEADAAITEAEKAYREDPLLIQLRREAYDSKNIKAARDVLDRKLIDYSSARFRDVYAWYIFPHNRQVNKDGSRNAPVLVYCGMVNARNRMGGMVGSEMMGWAPWGDPPLNACPGNYFETGMVKFRTERVGPAGGEALARAFDPASEPAR